VAQEAARVEKAVKAAPVAPLALAAPLSRDGDEEWMQQKYKGDLPYKRNEEQHFAPRSRFA